jgi:hypothetical protein
MGLYSKYGWSTYQRKGLTREGLKDETESETIDAQEQAPNANYYVVRIPKTADDIVTCTLAYDRC